MRHTRVQLIDGLAVAICCQTLGLAGHGCAKGTSPGKPSGTGGVSATSSLPGGAGGKAGVTDTGGDRAGSGGVPDSHGSGGSAGAGSGGGGSRLDGSGGSGGTRAADDFSSATLGLQWFFHTQPDAPGAGWSLSDRPGYLRLKTRAGDVNSADAYKGIPLQRVDRKRFDVETVVAFDAKGGSEAAGLLLHSTLAFNVTFSLTRAAAGKVIELASLTNSASRIDGATATRKTIASVPFDGTSAHLKVSFDGKENASFSFSADGSTWQAVGSAISVGLDGQVDLSWRLNAWTGATLGLFAVKRGATTDNYADFDSFTVASHD
jgi:hypothetical protein